MNYNVTNFRSIKEKQTLSLLKTKKNELENNFTVIPLSTGKNLDVLNFINNLFLRSRKTIDITNPTIDYLQEKTLMCLIVLLFMALMRAESLI
jgi:hypothetical protein